MKTDEQLYEAGDAAALVIRYRECLINYAAMRTGDDQLAERLADDALRHVAKHREEFWPGRPFRPWLFDVVDRLCLPHDSEAFKAEDESSDAAFAALDLLEARAPGQAGELFKEVCRLAEPLPHPWAKEELLKLAQQVLGA
jgi:DNA-directed RNA polymerase specialized sigma24 family protein